MCSTVNECTKTRNQLTSTHLVDTSKEIGVGQSNNIKLVRSAKFIAYNNNNKSNRAIT